MGTKPMWIQVQSETNDKMFSIEYRYGPDQDYNDAILYQKDGAWVFQPKLNSETKWLCHGNIEWLEALKRALNIIDTMK